MPCGDAQAARQQLVSLATSPDGRSRWEFETSSSSSPAFAVCFTPALGMHCIARRALAAGEPVLLEAPLVSTRTDLAPGLPSSECAATSNGHPATASPQRAALHRPEWMLVHALLGLGKRRRWAAQYAHSLPGEAPPAADVVCAWLAAAHGVGADVAALLWQVAASSRLPSQPRGHSARAGAVPGDDLRPASAAGGEGQRLRPRDAPPRHRVWRRLLRHGTLPMTPPPNTKHSPGCLRLRRLHPVRHPLRPPTLGRRRLPRRLRRLLSGLQLPQACLRRRAASTTAARPTVTRSASAATSRSTPPRPSRRATSSDTRALLGAA